MKFKLATLTIMMLGVFTSALAADEPIQPVKPVQSINLGQVELGKKLYFDPRLSKSGFISCNEPVEKPV
ncbi:MAG: cytochrome c peroxidase [Candidatus Thiodiazotropha sp.]